MIHFSCYGAFWYSFLFFYEFPDTLFCSLNNRHFLDPQNFPSLPGYYLPQGVACIPHSLSLVEHPVLLPQSGLLVLQTGCLAVTLGTSKLAPWLGCFPLSWIPCPSLPLFTFTCCWDTSSNNLLRKDIWKLNALILPWYLIDNWAG